VRALLLASAAVLPLAACKVGPDFVPPKASVADQWMELGDSSVKTQGQELEQWWTVYHDPTLDRLIDLAYHQNLTLMAAGTRVLEARAVLGINIGEFYPQTQQIGGNVGYNQASQVDPSSNPLHELENYGQVPPRRPIGRCVVPRIDRHLRRRAGVAAERRRDHVYRHPYTANAACHHP
jgi:hypothetical protein